MIKTLINALEGIDKTLNEKQIKQFQYYYSLLIEWNEKMNLTAITEPKEVAIKHFFDSATFLKYVKVKKGAKIIDVGTGAGFPGIPLKILQPDIELTLLDSLNKRLNFLNEVCNVLDIKAEIIHKRAEDGGRQVDLREKFDIATSRAVANMNTLCEYLMPYVKVGGNMVAMKGRNGKDELTSAKDAIAKLGGRINFCNEFALPTGDERTIIVVDKIKPCPKTYPRQTAKIKNNPLQ